MVYLTVFRIILRWVAVLLVAGCAGVTPYDPPEHGEMPPGRGLFTGADGEFVIYRGDGERLPVEKDPNREEQ
jgi:hypothetical protein